MAKKRSERTERRAAERSLRRLVQDREKLARLQPGGSEEHPIEVPAASVIEVRAAALPCPQCEGKLQLLQHRATASGLRALQMRCQRCGVERTLWFRIAALGPN
ncbi:MAG: hypothetical protein U1E65_13160 [Myxococcota bacterium]